jgi:hypothetical protein
LISRIALITRRNTGLLREIVLGDAKPGWIRARMTGKRYIDHGVDNPTELNYRL